MGSPLAVLLQAKHKKDKQSYVLKRVPLDLSTADEGDAALRECLVLSSLRHPHIVPYKVRGEPMRQREKSRIHTGITLAPTRVCMQLRGAHASTSMQLRSPCMCSGVLQGRWGPVPRHGILRGRRSV
jgi:hypothetical protein